MQWSDSGEPKYGFILNPYRDERFSKCPMCDKPANLRKFALFVAVKGWGTMVQGKTCRYCPRCELIIAHQDELEEELAINFLRLNTEMVGNPYEVLGTMDKPVWKKGMVKPLALEAAMPHVRPFKQVYELKYQ